MLSVSRNGYYQFIKSGPSKRSEENEELLLKIRKIHEASRRIYDTPRIHATLKREGAKCSRKRVAMLMKKNQMQAKMKKRFKKTTLVNPKATAVPNLLNSDLHGSAR